MENTNKIYHIYAKGQCIYHSLCEEEFTETWDMLTKFITVSGAVNKEDLEYVELVDENCKVIATSPSY